jgi:hypothetical protein
MITTHPREAKPAMIRRAALSAVVIVMVSAGPLLAQAQETPPAAPAAPATPSVPATPQTPAAPAEPATPPPVASEAQPPAAAQGTEAAIPEVRYGEDGLPDKVKAMRRRILDATRTGELDSLRPVLESNEMPPTLSGGGSDDPIATLRLLSGDDKGREILAILQEVLEAGYVHVDVGTPQEMYVWPYFARYPLDKLSGTQMVELFRLITAGDLQDMQEKGVYSFYRVGIGPDGTWHFFEDGD